MLNIFISNILYNTNIPHLHYYAVKNSIMTEYISHGLACDGVGIAKDDISEIEKMQKIEDITHELFRNAARIHKAMRTNGLLRDVFRKYKHACREILQKKKEALPHLVSLCDYCDTQTNAHEVKHDLKCIQREIDGIHKEIKDLEELKWSDDDSSDDSSESVDDDDEEQLVMNFHEPSEDDEEEDDDDNASVDSYSTNSTASSLSSDSSDSIMDMATFQ